MKNVLFGFIALSILSTPALAGNTAVRCTLIEGVGTCENGQSFTVSDGIAQPTKASPSTLGDFAKAAPAQYVSNYQSAQPAPTTPGTQDCYSLGSENLGCVSSRTQLPPGLVLQNGVMRTRTTTASDGSYGREVATFVATPMGGQWMINSQYYPPTVADSSTPSQDCGFLHLGCVRVYGLTETPGGRCRTYTYYHESRYGRTKSRSHDYRVSCY